MDKDNIKINITALKTNFHRKIDIEDLVILCQKKLPNWDNRKFKEIIDYIIDNYSNYPDNLIQTIEQINYNLFGINVQEIIKGCFKCNGTGYREYRTFVDWYDFDTKKIIKKKMPCISACGCELGRKRKREIPGLFWYNDVIKRNDVDPFEGKVDMDKVLKPLTDKKETEEKTIQGLIKKEPDYESELPF